MSETELLEPWKELRALLADQAGAEIRALVETLTPTDLARALSRLEEEERAEILQMLGPEAAADLLGELSDVQAADIIEDLPSHKAAEIVNEIASDHRADILAELDERDLHAILSHMHPEEADDARRLLQYPEDTAGGIMVTDFVVYPQSLTAGDVLKDMRENAERYSDIGVQYAYVSSDQGTLVGVVRLRDLLLAPANKPLAKLMIVNPIYVLADAPIDEIQEIFDRYTFWVLPVTDSETRLVGVVRRADLHEAIGEERDKAFLRYSGIISGEELRDMPLRERSFGRLQWLALNMTLSVAAASVILAFEDTIDSVFALVFFMPIICNMSGCSGNQAVAVSIRELTLGIINPSDFTRVLGKEVGVALINGAVLGSVLGSLAFGLNYFFWQDKPYLGLVIGGAFMLNTVLAVSLGGILPLLLRKLGGDPALGAPPILTTITDMCGFLLVLSFATAAIAVGIL